MITADKARALAGPTAQECVDAISDQIEKAATSKKRKIILRNEPWARNAYDATDLWKESCKILNELGYKTSMFYEEKQFVNIGTLVSWEES